MTPDQYVNNLGLFSSLNFSEEWFSESPARFSKKIGNWLQNNIIINGSHYRFNVRCFNDKDSQVHPVMMYRISNCSALNQAVRLRAPSGNILNLIAFSDLLSVTCFLYEWESRKFDINFFDSFAPGRAIVSR